MDQAAPWVWQRGAAVPAYTGYAPRVAGGVWNACWDGTPECAFEGGLRGYPWGRLGGIQNTVTNALYFVRDSISTRPHKQGGSFTLMCAHAGTGYGHRRVPNLNTIDIRRRRFPGRSRKRKHVRRPDTARIRRGVRGGEREGGLPAPRRRRVKMPAGPI